MAVTVLNTEHQNVCQLEWIQAVDRVRRYIKVSVMYKQIVFIFLQYVITYYIILSTYVLVKSN